MESREAIAIVGFVTFVGFVRTLISPAFSQMEREISHKEHKEHNDHKVAGDGTPANQ